MISNRSSWGRTAALAVATVFAGQLLEDGGAAAKRAAPAAEEAPAANAQMDVTALREHFLVLSDGKSHYVAVTPPGGDKHGIFYGDGKRFYSLPSPSSSASPPNWERSFFDPRLAAGGHQEGMGFVSFRDGKYVVNCGQRTTEMKLVDKAAAQPILQGATFLRSPRKYRPHALARDNTGRYFYVDRGFHKDEQQKFRLFAGPKGNLKQLKMTNVVSDSEGEIFATKTGSLRLVLDKKESQWIENEKPRKLVIVPTDFNVNVASVYNEFGIYAGERMGTPCDDL